MVYGYVRHSLNNQDFIEKQKKQLMDKVCDLDEIIIEKNKSESLHNMIQNLSEGDKIVAVATDRFKLIKEEDVETLQEKEIEIITLDGFHSHYTEDGLYMAINPLYEILQRVANKNNE